MVAKAAGGPVTSFSSVSSGRVDLDRVTSGGGVELFDWSFSAKWVWDWLRGVQGEVIGGGKFDDAGTNMTLETGQLASEIPRK